jgi:4-hydroxy-tetrahydrodipicolinate synthase
MSKRFQGLGVALITPFTAEGAIDFPGLERMVHHVSSSKAHFLLALGSTGEALLMSVEEQRRVLDFVMEVNAGRLPVVAGFDAQGGTDAAVERIHQLDPKGLSALLISPPAYIKPSQAGMVAHFTALAEASPLPIIMYNVPSRTGVTMAPETVISLAQSCPALIGLKQACDDMLAFREIRSGVPESFVLLSGDDENAIPMMAMGGDGLVSVIGNAYPDAWASAIDLALFGSVKEAEANLAPFQTMLGCIFEEGNPTGIKAVCELLGLCGPMTRKPLVAASGALRDALYNAIAALDAIQTPAQD